MVSRLGETILSLLIQVVHDYGFTANFPVAKTGTFTGSSNRGGMFSGTPLQISVCPVESHSTLARNFVHPPALPHIMSAVVGPFTRALGSPTPEMTLSRLPKRH